MGAPIQDDFHASIVGVAAGFALGGHKKNRRKVVSIRMKNPSSTAARIVPSPDGEVPPCQPIVVQRDTKSYILGESTEGGEDSRICKRCHAGCNPLPRLDDHQTYSCAPHPSILLWTNSMQVTAHPHSQWRAAQPVRTRHLSQNHKNEVSKKRDTAIHES